MSIPIESFWKLLAESRLVTPDEQTQLAAAYWRLSGTADSNAPALGQWLISAGVISPFQAKVLLAGKPGPFVFGPYRITDRIKSGRLTGVLRGVHAEHGQAVLLYFFPPAAKELPNWPQTIARLRAACGAGGLGWRTREIVEAGPQTFAVLDDVPGRALSECDEEPRGNIDHAGVIVAQVARELAALHAAALAYGAVRPQNVWMDEQGVARLLPLPLLIDGSTATEPSAADDVRDLARLVEPGQSPPADSSTSEPPMLKVVTHPIVRPVGPSADFDPTALPPSFARSGTGVGGRRKQAGANRSIAIGVALAALATVLIVVLANSQGNPERAAGQQAANDASSTPSQPNSRAAASSQPNDSIRKSSDATASQSSVKPPTNADRRPPSNRPAAVPSPPDVQEIEDDGQTPWASPTTGEPLDLKYCPAGAQVILALRPAELAASVEGQRFLESLGPAGAAGVEHVRAVTGFAPDEIAELHVAFFIAADNRPEAAFVVRLTGAAETSTLLERWQAPQATPLPAIESDDATADENGARTSGSTSAADQPSSQYYRGPRWSYWIPPGGEGRVFIAAPTALVPEIIADPNPPRRREMERLIRTTDRSRHATILFAPKHFSSDGQALLAGELAGLQKPLEWFLGDSVQAAGLSLHLGENLFIELRAIGSLDEDAQRLAGNLRERLTQMPERVESYLAELNPQPYGRHILLRFPRMIQALADYTRTDAADKQAVVRVYLPGVAAHNLALGAELALAERQGGPTATAAGEPAPAARSPGEALARRISLSFPRDTLEKSIEMLGREINVPVEILGSDLQLEGITKNQSFGLDERDQPAAEILRTILRQANPDGKLIYVIKPDAGGRDTIFVTTRAAAAKRGDAIPPELAAPEPTKPQR